MACTENVKRLVIWPKAKRQSLMDGEFVASKERCDAPVRSPPQGKEPDVDEATKDEWKEVHHY